MNLDELKETHKKYQANMEEWKMYKAAYSGTKELLDWGAITQNSRESPDDFKTRKREAFGFNYTSRIIAIINNYIFQKGDSHDYGGLQENEFFRLFLDNCDLQGNTFSNCMSDRQKWAGVFGHIGILVDKARSETALNLEDSLRFNHYPFLTSYSPLNILDWKTVTTLGKSELSYLKLLDHDGKYRIWTLDSWELWEIVEGQPHMVDAGENTLGEIPFVFMINEQSGERFMGKSDIKEIARMDIALLRLLSGSEEIFKLASFPMLMRPYLPPGAKDNEVVGAGNVIEFDPKNPASKPEWLSTAIKEPIAAIMEWVDMIIEEMYKTVNANGLNVNSQAKSGEALKREFQSLNSFLAKKSKNTVLSAEKNIIRLWLKWQGQEELMEEVTLTRPTEFDISSLSEDLDNYAAARMIVRSKAFDRSMQKIVARKILTGMNQKDQEVINNEIDEQQNIDLSQLDDAPEEG